MKNKILILSLLASFAVNCGASARIRTETGNPSTINIRSFVGIWSYEYVYNPEDMTEDLINSSFELCLKEDDTKANSLTGWHCSAVRGGRKIDYADYDGEPSIRGYLKNDTVYLHFFSSWDVEGDAKLYFGNSGHTVLIWELGEVKRMQPDEEYKDEVHWAGELEHYMPKTDTLQKVINVHMILPDDSTRIDKNRVEQIQKMMDEIDAMPLICDTIDYEPFRGFCGYYFDKRGRLRKYLEEYDGYETDRMIIAYYDEKGDLIYLRKGLYGVSESSDEYYYVDNKTVVDFRGKMEGYFGQKGATKDEGKRTHQLIGSVLAKSIIRHWSDVDHMEKVRFGHYLEAKTFLNHIEWNGISLKQFGSFDKRKASDIAYYENLEAIGGALQDSIDNPKAYLIEVDNSPYSPRKVINIAIRKNDNFVTFTINPRWGSGYLALEDFSIGRQNIDNTGSEELIIRWKNERSEEKDGHTYKNSGIVIWDIDAYTCLLDFQDTYIYHNDEDEEADQPMYLKYKVDLDTNLLTIQKVTDFIYKKSDGEKSGLKYIYKLTESGFILDKVE